MGYLSAEVKKNFRSKTPAKPPLSEKIELVNAFLQRASLQFPRSAHSPSLSPLPTQFCREERLPHYICYLRLLPDSNLFSLRFELLLSCFVFSFCSFLRNDLTSFSRSSMVFSSILALGRMLES